MFTKLERTVNATRNMHWGLINKIVTLFFPLAIRMLIIKKIGAEYIGLSGLFSSILQVLNITEFGFSSAIVYSMYKPIADEDTEAICGILGFYRKIYFTIGSAIAIIGLSITPALPKIIKGDIPQDINIYVLYLIYLASTVLSYFLFSYKNSLLTAYQRADIISNINTFVNLAIYLAQFIIITVSKNYYLYALTLLVSSFLQNIFADVFSRILFPQISSKGKLDDNIKSDILTKAKGLFVNKLCGVSRNAFDSIFLSAFLGLTITAIYNNYFSIMSAIIGFLSIILNSILAGVGNSITTESQRKNYNDLKKFNFIYMWLSGFCTACLVCLYQPFTIMAFGNDMMFPFSTTLLLCIYFYILKMGDIRSVYSDAKGLWWENRHRSVAEAIANLSLNFILGKFFGVTGIIIATILSLFIINFLWGSSIIFKYYFTEVNMMEYYYLHLFYAIVNAISCALCYFLCSKVSAAGMQALGIRFAICLVAFNSALALFYSKFPLFKISREWIMELAENFSRKRIAAQVKKAPFVYGLNEKEKRPQKIIVSLTSYPERFESIPLCLKSLILQTKKPDKILVYIDKEREALTPSMLAFEQYGIEFICGVEDLKPHKKYFFAMRQYPNDIIVTVDDDSIYPADTLASLFKTHEKYPYCVCARRVHKKVYAENKKPLPYRLWDDKYKKEIMPSFELMATGVGGVLYPPHSLDERVFDVNLIKKYCLNADDIWLHCMELLRGTKTVWVPNKILTPPQTENSQATNLYSDNVKNNKNDEYIKNVLSLYGTELKEKGFI